MDRLKLLLGAVAIHMIGFGAVIPIMPHVITELGGNAATQGMLISLYSLAQLATAPFWGYLSDRIGRGAVVSLGLLLATAGNTAAFFSSDIQQLALARAISGVGGGTLGALQALIADLSDRGRLASAMALFGMAFGIGFILGPVLGVSPP